VGKPVPAFVTNKRGAFPTRGLSFLSVRLGMSEKLYGENFGGEGDSTFWVNFSNIFAEGIDKNTV